MFTYWLLLAFLLFCLGDIISFYEMQKTFWCCSGLFLLFEIVCLCKNLDFSVPVWPCAVLRPGGAVIVMKKQTGR